MAIGMFSVLTRLVTGKTIKDPTSGLQGLSRNAVLCYSQYNCFDDRYPDTNMVIQMLLLGYRIKEIPAVMHRRQVGRGMHTGIKSAMYMFRMGLSVLAVLIRIKVLKIGIEIADGF